MTVEHSWVVDGDHFPAGPLTGAFMKNGRRLVLVQPFVFADHKDLIKVPSGFVTDFNSVPRVLWSWFPPWEVPEAGCVHDYLYRHPEGRSRRRCDDLHRRILHLKGVRKTKRLMAWLGIRAGGWKAWNAYRKGKEPE